MIKSWRPEGWATRSVISYTGKNMKDCTGREVFEAGADAMLEALRELGNSRGGREDNEYRKGTWVFIEETDDR